MSALFHAIQITNEIMIVKRRTVHFKENVNVKYNVNELVNFDSGGT